MYHDTSKFYGSRIPTVERVRALHYEIEHETIAFIRDPDGHLIELNDFHGRC